MQDLLTRLIKQQVNEAFNQKAAEAFGLKTEQTSKLTQNALPVLLNGLAKNSESKTGAESLFKALSKDKHNGNILEHVDDLFKAPEKGEGNGILRHVLGDVKEDVAEAIAYQSGADQDSSKKMMMVLAPMVMGALGKAVRSEKLNAEQLGALLQMTRKDKSMGSVADNIAKQFLDKDGDGDYKDDLFNMAKKWLSGYLTKKGRK